MAEKNEQEKQTWKIFLVIAIFVVIAGGLIAFAMLARKNTVSICAKCEYDGDYCNCVERKDVKVIPGSEKDYECKGGGKKVYDQVGGIVWVRFMGCTDE